MVRSSSSVLRPYVFAVLLVLSSIFVLSAVSAAQAEPERVRAGVVRNAAVVADLAAARHDH